MNSATVLGKLLDILWSRYRERVSYAAQYQEMVEERGGTVRNDHIAFRTFNTDTGAQLPGVEGIARIFTALGYEQKDSYLFPDKKLTAWHYEHKTNPSNPKIFISQLEVNRLPQITAAMIQRTVGQARDLLAAEDWELLDRVADGETIPLDLANALAANLACFFMCPWNPPRRDIIVPVDTKSQYAAWTLLHGNAVNHFTAFVNAQNVAEWPDLETTVNALRAAGLPMKAELEGKAGSKLRQSSTKAVDCPCEVAETDGSTGTMTWSYAYYELAERGMVLDERGKQVQFQGFLGAQATNLFEMTKRAGNQ